ncbi:MAG: hypothetical protein HY047_17820 [Acidobacteria bacterium]|nr:hypothetical protein [Acidobacteriota bacterium]
MAQHATLTPARWSTFSFDQQILMIANEMHRAGKLTGPDDDVRRASAYERVLRLTDLTIQTATRRAVRRELLRWRDLAAALYVEPEANVADHDAAWRSLLRFTPEASRQLNL